VLVVLRAKDAGTWRSFLAAGLLLGAGHLVKESAFFGFAALAAVAGRPRRIWGWAAAGFLAVVLAECLFYLAATGDPLFRVHAIRTMQTEDIDAMLSEVSVPGRLLASVAGLFVPGTGAWVFFGPLPLLALAGAVLAWRRREAGLRPAAVWTGVVLALLLFWPITLWPYRPALRAPARIFLAVEIPLAALAASLLARLKRPANWAVAAAAVAVAVPCSWAIHADARRHSAGAALAYRHLPPGLPVITDPRTKPLFRLFDGYRNPNRWLTWSDPPVAGSHLRVVNQRGLSMDREWGGAPPPSGFVGKEGETVFEGSVPGRLRLRGLLAGRAERGASESVAVYRIAP
jgi:hypothetical protein